MCAVALPKAVLSRSDREGFESAFLPSLRSSPLCQLAQVSKRDVLRSTPHGHRRVQSRLPEFLWRGQKTGQWLAWALCGLALLQECRWETQGTLKGLAEATGRPASHGLAPCFLTASLSPRQREEHRIADGGAPGSNPTWLLPVCVILKQLLNLAEPICLSLKGVRVGGRSGNSFYRHLAHGSAIAVSLLI